MFSNLSLKICITQAKSPMAANAVHLLWPSTPGRSTMEKCRWWQQNINDAWTDIQMWREWLTSRLHLWWQTGQKQKIKCCQTFAEWTQDLSWNTSGGRRQRRAASELLPKAAQNPNLVLDGVASPAPTPAGRQAWAVLSILGPTYMWEQLFSNMTAVHTHTHALQTTAQRSESDFLEVQEQKLHEPGELNN